MEKYRLVQEHKGDGDDFLEPTMSCEVRITQQGKPRNYISYAMGLFVRIFCIDFLILCCVSRQRAYYLWSLSPPPDNPGGRFGYNRSESHGTCHQ